MRIYRPWSSCYIKSASKLLIHSFYLMTFHLITQCQYGNLAATLIVISININSHTFFFLPILH